MMSFKYRAMIYFAHSTLVIYSKTITSNSEMSIQQFRDENKDVIQRVFDEGISIFNYELSHEQISRAISVYLMATYSPTSVYEKAIYQLTED